MASTTTYSWSEIVKHNREGDLWVVIHNRVYNVSQWIHDHPGGDKVINCLAGKDATDIFTVFHSKGAWSLMTKYCIGNVSDPRPVEPHIEGFRKLHRQLHADGLFKPSLFWYFVKVIFIAFLFFAALKCAFVGTSTSVVIGGLLLGTFWMQLEFLAHDHMHSAVTHDQKKDALISCLFVSVFTGLSGNWWKTNHNYHHVTVNSVEHDPDIQHMPVMAISTRFFEGIKSEYYGWLLPFNDVAKVFIRVQHRLFYVLMAVGRFNMYAMSWMKHYQNDHPPSFHFKYVERTSMVLFWVWLTYVVSHIPTWELRLTFLVVAHFANALIHTQVTLSHFAMPINEEFGKNPDYDFVMTQLKHSLDIDCYPFFDWVHGGLQFQIVHHLFPRLPRNSLREATEKYLKPYCDKYGLPYHSCSFFEANRRVLATLQGVAHSVDKSCHLD